MNKIITATALIIIVALALFVTNKKESTDYDSGGLSEVHVDVVLYLFKNSGKISTRRDKSNAKELFGESQRIWEQANIKFVVEVVELTVDEHIQQAVSAGNYEVLREVEPSNSKIHIYFTQTLNGTNGIALGDGVAVIADVTTVNDYRATAHEIGHLLGLRHTSDTQNRLMFQGANGEELVETEVMIARKNLVKIAPDSNSELWR